MAEGVDQVALQAAADALIDSAIARIEEIRSELQEAFVEVVGKSRSRLCGLTDPTSQVPCDRPHMHGGDCSWESQRLRRRYREFEEAAAQVPTLQRQVQRLAGQLIRARASGNRSEPART